MCRTGVQHRLIRCSGLQIWQRFSWRCFDTLIKRCKSYLVPIVSRRAELGSGQPSRQFLLTIIRVNIKQQRGAGAHRTGDSAARGISSHILVAIFFVSLVNCKDCLPVIGQRNLMGATLANHRQQTTKVSAAIWKVVAKMVKCQFIWKWPKQNQWDRIATASLDFIKC